MQKRKNGQLTQQLALAIQRNDEATFADFCWGGNSVVLHQQLLSALHGRGERFIYLWGHAGSGKTHLLQACCQAIDPEKSAIYLPLHILREWGPQVIEGVGEQALICIDDLDTIAQDAAWEEAVFHLYNRIRDQGQGTLIMSGRLPPANIPVRLLDLRSRLSWGLITQLHELSDSDKIRTLQQHASNRGFELPSSVGQFLLNRCSRNMHDLLTRLNQLDNASLIAQRKVTIPFVKHILGI